MKHCAAALVVLSGCSGGTSGPAPLGAVAGVEIQPNITSLTAGQVQQFRAVAFDANHDSLPISDFQWSATPGTIASVSASGAVSVAGVGAFVLTASTSGVTGRDSILAKVDSIHIAPSPDTVEADSGTSQLTAQGFGVNGAVVSNLSDSSFSWTSATPATATVSTRGGVVGLQTGAPVTITASLPAALGGGHGTTQVVVVSRVAFIAALPAIDTTTVADTVTFAAILKDSLGHPLSGPITRWTSSDTTIAVIDPVTGHALIKATGSATITATSEGKQGTATIYGRVPWKTLSAGSDVTCGVTTGNVAYCWGFNGQGELGIGTNPPPLSSCNDLPCSLIPLAVVAPTGGSPLAFKSVSVGFAGACGITIDSLAIYCWGDAITPFGQTGPLTPTAVAPWPFLSFAKPSITSVTVGAFAACAVDLSTVGCFGANQAGNIGNGARFSAAALPPTFTMTEGNSPIHPPSGANGLATTPEGTVICALQRGAATLWCWGNNIYGQTGDTTRGVDSLAYPVVFPAMSSSNLPIQVAVGYETACTLLADGSVDCWGFNGSGEYGNGTKAKSLPTSFTPTAAQLPVPLTTISLGATTVCGLDNQGTAWCWGEVPGTGGASTNLQPTPVTAPVAFKSLTANYVVCGLDAVGTAYCWGDNGFGALGNGTETSSSIPVRVAAPVTPGQPLGSAVVARVHAQRLRLASAALRKQRKH